MSLRQNSNNQRQTDSRCEDMLLCNFLHSTLFYQSIQSFWTAMIYSFLHYLTKCRFECIVYESLDCGSTGLISTTGVPSIASIGPTFNLFPATSKTVTRCKPSGLG